MMDTSRSGHTKGGSLPALIVGAACALVAVGATWYFLRPTAPRPLEFIPEGTSQVYAAENAPAKLTDLAAAPEGSDRRVAATLPPANEDDSPQKEELDPLMGLEGKLSHSGLGPAFKLSSIKALAAVVSVGGKKQYLTIPVRGDRFRLEYLPQEDGSFALANGSRRLSRAALDAIEAATIELIAPTLSDSGSSLRFLDPKGTASPPERRVQVPFGERALVLTLQAPPIVRLWATDLVSGTSLEGADVHLAPQAIQVTGIRKDRLGLTVRGTPSRRIAKQLMPGGVISLSEERTDSGAVKLEVQVAGYVPGEVTANFLHGGDLHVALQRSGSVVVEIAGGPVGGGKVTLRSAGGAQAGRSWMESRPLNRLKELQFDSVPPGPVLVSVEGALDEPDARSAMALLDIQEALVTSGGVTTVRLRAVSNALSRARAAGRILLPEAWEGFARIDLKFVSQQGLKVPSIECSARLAFDDSPNGYRAYAFDAGELPLGRYTLELQSPTWKSQILVPPGGTTELELRVPEPTLFSIRLVDVDTGKLAPHTELSLGFPPLLPFEPERSRLITRPASEEAFRFQATSRRIVLTAPETAEYEALYQWLLPEDGAVEVTRRIDGSARK